MSKRRGLTIVLAVVVVILGAVLISRRQRVSDERRRATLISEIKRLGIEPVMPRVDPTTAFLVGGKNPTALIRRLTEINGRKIAALEHDMRPKALSEAGFLGADESLLDVLAADNAYVVDQLGLTHQELAQHLQVLAAIEEERRAQGVWGSFSYQGRRYKVERWGYLGKQDSPFADDTYAYREALIENLDNGKKLWFSYLVPEMIERYGFYEGKGTRYRVDPRAIVELLDFLPDGKQR